MMLPLIGRKAPDFISDAVMPDDRIEAKFNLSSLQGSYVVLFFYPMDFTFVCPSEILAFNEQLEEFRTRGAEVIGVSVDSAYTHLAWKRTPVEKGGIGPIRFPLVSDLKKDIAQSYGVLTEEGVALRGLFLIDQQGIVRHSVLNDPALGRSVTETLRMLDALRFYEKRGKLCPADWQNGEEGITPTSDGIVDYLSKYAGKRFSDSRGET